MSETISIIIPTYEHGSSIGACLDSLLSQTRLPDEIIVVDDGSIDDTRERLEPYTEKLTYIYQDNAGAALARMVGFEKSSGSLILFCDADIRARKDMLETLEKALRNDSVASWAYSGFRWGWKRFRSKPFDPELLKQMNYIHTSALIRREHFPGFDIKLTRFQDWDLWLTMVDHGRKGVFVDELLFRVVHQRGHRGMSVWLPSILYKLRWKLPAVQNYERARQILIDKHGL